MTEPPSLPGKPSGWSAVDAAADPRRLLASLDTLRAEPFFAQSKARLAEQLRRAPPGRIVDIGCGTGDDAAALANDHTAIGIESSNTMCAEARARFPQLPVVVGDALALPLPAASVAGVRADRVLQHLTGAPAALREWRRVLRYGGRLATFDPDLTTATVDGVDPATAATVLGWRAGTRPGAATLSDLRGALERAGFTDIDLEPRVLDLTDLDRADGIMGLAEWGVAAAAAHETSPDEGRRWREAVHTAWRRGTLRYRCAYILATGGAG